MSGVYVAWSDEDDEHTSPEIPLPACPECRHPGQLCWRCKGLGHVSLDEARAVEWARRVARA